MSCIMSHSNLWSISNHINQIHTQQPSNFHPTPTIYLNFIDFTFSILWSVHWACYVKHSMLLLYAFHLISLLSFQICHTFPASSCVFLLSVLYLPFLEHIFLTFLSLFMLLFPVNDAIDKKNQEHYRFPTFYSYRYWYCFRFALSFHTHLALDIEIKWNIK